MLQSKYGVVIAIISVMLRTCVVRFFYLSRIQSCVIKPSLQRQNSVAVKTEPSSDSVCAGCLNVLDDEEFIAALGQEWHMECFR